MKAKLEPLDGKYYGSSISVRLDDGSFGEINVWIHDRRWIPSRRELERWRFKTPEEAKDNDVTCDSHFESDVGYEICLKIVEALNRQP